jgi:hypothetical protein
MIDEGYRIYETVSADAARNAAFALFGVGAIWIMSKISLFFARGIFWLAVTAMVLSALHFMVVFVLGLLSARKNTKWDWAAHIVRGLEEISCFVLWIVAAKIVNYL